MEMKLGAIASWFGSKRTLAPIIAEQLPPTRMYFSLCCGSMADLFAREPSEHETVVDLHGGVINLAKVLQSSDASELFDMLSKTLYCDALFERSKKILAGEMPRKNVNQLAWAYHFFIVSWMGRNGVSGTQRHNFHMATRWTAAGGSGPHRFRSAVDSIPAWHERLRNVHIMQADVFEVLPKIEDAETTGIYIDPPYLWETMSGSGRYEYDFKPDDHKRLADALCRFKRARIVVSYYDSPLLEELYPDWAKMDCSRNKNLSNGSGKVTTAPEVLLINGPIIEEERGLF